MSFTTKLTNLLKTNPNFIDGEGELLLAAVQDSAWKIEHALIKLLLSDEEVKTKFFDEIDGYWVFNINTFLDYISQKNFLDNSYTRFRNKVGLTIGGKYLSERGEVALTWAYKDCMLEGGQTKEEERRKEIFFNEILAQDEINRLLDPKVLTNFKRYTTAGVQTVTNFRRDENGVIRENLIIKGNNLLALHALKNQFRGKVNLIYIDPPFNTGNDSFGYNDIFNHSAWLTFMRNRLSIAKEFLTEDGNIFIHIDINESHYLKILSDEVFGRDNFVEEIIWSYGSPSGGRAAGAKPVNIHDYILHYAKNYHRRKQKKLFTPYPEKYINDWFKYSDKDGRIYRRRQRGKDANGNPIWTKQYLDESKGLPLTTVWTDIKQVYADPRAYKESQANNVELIKEFPTQKPETLLKRIMEMASDPGDIVLDFHLGSGTTAAVAQKINRQYIGVEQLEVDVILKRLSKVINGDSTGISKLVNWVGGGNFIFCELMQYNQVFIDRIQKANTSEHLLKIWRDMAENSFLNWYVNAELPEEAINDFIAIGQGENGLEKQKKLLIELLDKNQLYVNLSEIDDDKYDVSEEDKALNKAFYGEF